MDMHSRSTSYCLSTSFNGSVFNSWCVREAHSLTHLVLAAASAAASAVARDEAQEESASRPSLGAHLVLAPTSCLAVPRRRRSRNSLSVMSSSTSSSSSLSSLSSVSA